MSAALSPEDSDRGDTTRERRGAGTGRRGVWRRRRLERGSATQRFGKSAASDVLYSRAMTRTAVLTVAVLMSIGGIVSEQAKSQMPIDVGPGRLAWFDITTKDVPRAKEFYGKLFGWTFGAVAGTDQAAEIMSRGQAIGTIRSADGAISGFNGVSYIQVDDVVKASESAKTLGATVIPGFPFNLPGDRGAISLFLDPSGHPLGMYSRTRIPGK